MRDKVGATAELSTVEASGYSHPSSVRAYFSIECTTVSISRISFP